MAGVSQQLLFAALLALCRTLPSTFLGSVGAMPVLAMLAFAAATRCVPVDGSVRQVIKERKQLLRSARIVVMQHCGIYMLLEQYRRGDPRLHCIWLLLQILQSVTMIERVMAMQRQARHLFARGQYAALELTHVGMSALNACIVVLSGLVVGRIFVVGGATCACA